jgi:hypothetical protein
MRIILLILSFFVFAGSSITLVPVQSPSSDVFFYLGDCHAIGRDVYTPKSDYTKQGWSSDGFVKNEIHTKYRLQFSIGQEVRAQSPAIKAVTIGKNFSSVTTSAANQDLFLVAGDSWAQGNSTAAGPDATGKEDYFRTSDNTFQPVTTTDIPGSVNGSWMPQFGIDYFNATGVKAAIIPTGVGGSKFFDTWNGTSATYLAAKQDAVDAMAVAGVTRLKGIIILCGVNDARGGDNIIAISNSIGNLFYQLNIDFPFTPIYVVMLGHSTTNGNRLPQVRGYVREQVLNYTNAQIVCQAQAMHEWTPPAGSPGGYYQVDDLHLNAAGNNLLGTMINRYIQLPTSISKYARAIGNSFYSAIPLSGSSEIDFADIDNWVTAQGAQYHNWNAFFWMDVPDKNDVFVDWGLCNPLIDNGFAFSANNFITANTGQTVRMNISANNSTYRWSNTDVGIVCATLDRKGAFGGTTKYLFGTSSGSNVFGVAETAAGVVQNFVYDLGTASTGTGGITDDTEYDNFRSGTLKSIAINGVVVRTETIAALTALTSAPEFTGRNTAGVGFELNSEILYFGWHKGSGWDPAVSYSANTTLKAQT